MLFRILAKVLLKLQATKSEQDKKIKKDDSMDRKKVEMSSICTGRQAGEMRGQKAK